VQFSKILFVYDMLELDVCTKKEAKRRKVEELDIYLERENV